MQHKIVITISVQRDRVTRQLFANEVSNTFQRSARTMQEFKQAEHEEKMKWLSAQTKKVGQSTCSPVTLLGREKVQNSGIRGRVIAMLVTVLGRGVKYSHQKRRGFLSPPQVHIYDIRTNGQKPLD